MGRVTTREIQYKTFGRALEISNGIINLVVTLDLGPRILRYGFEEGINHFSDRATTEMRVGEETWRILGGHRLWHSPEAFPRTYMPDNNEVRWEAFQGGVKLVQKVEPWVQTQKELELYLNENSSEVKIIHRIMNKNAWPIKLSSWAVSIMDKGGLEIIPVSDRATGYLPNKNISLWAYSKMNDSRVYWGDKYITLKLDETIDHPFKVGINNEKAWAAYINHGELFVLKHEHDINATYPDGGVSYETFTYLDVLEMETLSPMKEIEPEGSVVHVEYWSLYKGINIPEKEEQIDLIVEKYLKKG